MNKTEKKLDNLDILNPPIARQSSLIEHSSKGDSEVGEIKHIEKAIQIYKNSNVKVDLHLMVWNVDDRILQDSEQNFEPLFEDLVVSKTKLIPEEMSSFDHMDLI